MMYSRRNKLTTWFALSLATCSLAWASAEELTTRYEGQIRLPLDLHTTDGIAVQRGNLGIEVRLEKGHHLLLFFRDGAMIAAVNGQPVPQDRDEVDAIPLVGTVSLSPVDPPLGPEQTAKDNPEEPKVKEWEAALRVYGVPKIVQFVFFKRKRGRSQWSRIVFKLLLPPKPDSPSFP